MKPSFSSICVSFALAMFLPCLPSVYAKDGSSISNVHPAPTAMEVAVINKFSRILQNNPLNISKPLLVKTLVSAAQSGNDVVKISAILKYAFPNKIKLFSDILSQAKEQVGGDENLMNTFEEAINVGPEGSNLKEVFESDIKLDVYSDKIGSSSSSDSGGFSDDGSVSGSGVSKSGGTSASSSSTSNVGDQGIFSISFSRRSGGGSYQSVSPR